MTSSTLNSSYCISNLSPVQKKQLLENACTECKNALWRVVNGKVQGYCKLLFQDCYDRSHETEIVVTLCDGNPEIEEEAIDNAVDIAETAKEEQGFDPSELEDLV